MFWREILVNADPTLANELSGLAEAVAFPSGTTLFTDGEVASAMFFLSSGRALVSYNGVPGGPVALNVAEAGSVLGVRAISSPGSVHTATCMTVEDVTALRITPALWESLRLRHPSIDQLVVSVLDREVDAGQARLHEAVHATASDRICDRLTVLGSAHDGRVRMSQASLAELAGATRPTVNRILQRLQESEIIDIRRARIDILDAERLRSADFAESSGDTGS